MSVKPVEPNDPLPRYYQVYASLLERIRSGEFQPGDAIPSERILVGDYQVSRITIVKALDVLERDGLIDRQHGRGTYVTSPPTETDPQLLKVAFLMGRTSKPYPYAVLTGAVQTAMQYDVQFQVFGSHETAQEARYVRSAIQTGVDGIIVYPTPELPNESLYRELLANNFPFVMVDRYFPHVDADRVVFDDEAAGYQLTEYLIQQGHSRIAIVPLAEVMVSSVRNRIRGYQKALEAHGIEYDEDLVWLDVYEALDSDKPIRKDQPSDRRLLQRLEKDRPTALVGINYDVAEQILADLNKIKTERVASVMEGAVVDTADELNISLATISNRWFSNKDSSLVALALQSGETLGAQAMELLLRRIQKIDTGPMKSVIVPMEIHRLI
jgi:DNA-binding LacI/PurR family transcriptional regulator